MIKKYDKLELAEKQLEAGVILYLGAKDYISASTLASAAGEVFHQYLRLNNNTTTAKRVASVFQELNVPGVKVQKVRSALKNMSSNYLRHRKCNDPLYVSFDYPKEAINNIIMAVTDYKEIFHGTPRNSYINPLSNALAGEYIRETRRPTVITRKWYKTIALTQLRNSINLFASEQYAAAITLAGAADDILTSLLETKGKKFFQRLSKKRRSMMSLLGK